MQKVHIVDPNSDAAAAASPNEGHSRSVLTTLHEAYAENMTSQKTLNTMEAMQVAVEEFQEHVENEFGVTFKQVILDKVKSLKKHDTTILTERVEELKGQEGSELSKLNAIYMEKKLKVRHMEAQVSKHKITHTCRLNREIAASKSSSDGSISGVTLTR